MRTPPFRVALFALAAALAATASQAGRRMPLSTFAIAPERGVADTLALCDLTAFLASNPNLDSDVIFATDEAGHRFMPPMRHPLYRPANLVFDNKVRRAVQRLEGAGLVKREAIADARARYDDDMLESWRYATPSDRRFVDAQFKRCGRIEDHLIDAPAADLPSAVHAPG
jgi:hypothetical protein